MEESEYQNECYKKCIKLISMFAFIKFYIKEQCFLLQHRVEKENP